MIELANLANQYGIILTKLFIVTATFFAVLVITVQSLNKQRNQIPTFDEDWIIIDDAFFRTLISIVIMLIMLIIMIETTSVFNMNIIIGTSSSIVIHNIISLLLFTSVHVCSFAVIAFTLIALYYEMIEDKSSLIDLVIPGLRIILWSLVSTIFFTFASMLTN